MQIRFYNLPHHDKYHLPNPSFKLSQQPNYIPIEDWLGAKFNHTNKCKKQISFKNKGPKKDLYLKQFRKSFHSFFCFNVTTKRS